MSVRGHLSRRNRQVHVVVMNNYILNYKTALGQKHPSNVMNNLDLLKKNQNLTLTLVDFFTLSVTMSYNILNFKRSCHAWEHNKNN